MFTNKEKEKGGFLRRPVAMVAMVGLAAAMAIGVGVSSASAASGTLTNASWAVSNSQMGATGVTYTYQGTVATSGIIGSVNMYGPPMPQSAGLGTVYGLGAGTVSTVGGIGFVYTVTSPVSVSAGTPFYIEITNVTNSWNSQSVIGGISTFNNASTPVQIDSANPGTVVFGSQNTAVTLQVAKSLSFTNDTPAYTLLMDPSLPALADIQKTINLGVKTNAGQGYSLSMKDTGLKTAGTGAAAYTIPAGASSLSYANFAANSFGTTIGGMTAANSIPVPASIYSNVFSGFATAGASLMSASKPTGNTADVISLVNRVKIDYTTPAGTYTDTITYTATPAY